MPDNVHIAFIGTGSMGRPMIFELLAQGYCVNVYDKDKKVAEGVMAAGAVWAETPRIAAHGTTVVITCLPLPHHVLDNMLGENGALAGMQAGDIWIDTSTTDYHNTLRIAAAATEQGVLSLEAPVSNLSHMGVDFTNSSFYVGGDEGGYQQCKPLFNAMGQISFYVGKIGTAQTVKLLTNLLFYTATVISGEVLCLAQEAGIPLHWMWAFLKASKGDNVATEQFMPFLFDGSYDASCSLEITVKDMSLTVALADELGVALPIGRIVNERYHQAGLRYDGQNNHIKVLHLNEVDNQCSLRIEGFMAASKYGANPNYVPTDERITDQYGRTKPKPPPEYQAPPYQPQKNQRALAETLSNFMAYVNYGVLNEAYELGRQMGLDQALLTQVIRWSVGTSWVADHYEDFQSDADVIERLLALETPLVLPAISKLGALSN